MEIARPDGGDRRGHGAGAGHLRVGAAAGEERSGCGARAGDRAHPGRRGARHRQCRRLFPAGRHRQRAVRRRLHRLRPHRPAAGRRVRPGDVPVPAGGESLADVPARLLTRLARLGRLPVAPERAAPRRALVARRGRHRGCQRAHRNAVHGRAHRVVDLVRRPWLPAQPGVGLGARPARDPPAGRRRAGARGPGGGHRRRR